MFIFLFLAIEKTINETTFKKPPLNKSFIFNSNSSTLLNPYLRIFLGYEFFSSLKKSFSLFINEFVHADWKSNI